MQAKNEHSTSTGNGGEANPDAELIRLGAELAAIIEAENALPDDPDEAEAAGAGAIFQRGSATVRAILAKKARTLAGVQVKVRALAWCAVDEELGEEMFSPGIGELTTDLRLAGSIAGDLLAMVHPIAATDMRDPLPEATSGAPLEPWSDEALRLGLQRLPKTDSFSPRLGLKMLNARLELARRSALGFGRTA